MSTSRLAVLALVLTLVLVAAALLTMRRLGRIGRPEVPALDFRNHLLAVEKFQRVAIRPMRQGGESARYTFTALVGEPAAVEDAPLPLPYAAAAFEFLPDGGDRWLHRPEDRIQLFPLGLLGALSPKEWLTEIRPVLEEAPDGSVRPLIRVTYGHETGQTMAYFYDPSRPVPGFGWVRTERYRGSDEEPEIHHAREVAPLRPR